jgi:hypothetical protein
MEDGVEVGARRVSEEDAATLSCLQAVAWSQGHMILVCRHQHKEADDVHLRAPTSLGPAMVEEVKASLTERVDDTPPTLALQVYGRTPGMTPQMRLCDHEVRNIHRSRKSSMMCNPLKKTISPVLMTRPRMRPLQTQKVFRHLRTTRARAMCRQEWLQPLQPLLQVQ